MSEEKGEYKTGNPEADGAMEMLGKGYENSSLEIHPQTTVIRRKGWEMVEEVVPAFVKISTAFKQEMATIDGDALKVWLFIALSINRNTEQAHPGVRTIATACGMGQNKAIVKIKELEGLGLLSVNRKDRKYNIYEIPDYISANAKTASKMEAVNETASENPKTASEKEQTAFDPAALKVLNQRTREPDNKRPLKKGDLIDGVLFYAEQSKERGEDKIEEILCNLEHILHRNIQRTGQWQDLAKWMLRRLEKEPYTIWASWYMADPFNAKTSWRIIPKQIRESWPQAFQPIAESGYRTL